MREGNNEEDKDGEGNREDGVMSREELFNDAMKRLVVEDIPVELRPVNLKEERIVKEFMKKGCGCKKWGGRHCSSIFMVEYVKKARAGFARLSGEHLDVVIMGEMLPFLDTSEMTSCLYRNKCRSHERQRIAMKHMHTNRHICKRMFRFIHGVGKKRLENVTSWLLEHGPCSRVQDCIILIYTCMYVCVCIYIYKIYYIYFFFQPKLAGGSF